MRDFLLRYVVLVVLMFSSVACASSAGPAGDGAPSNRRDPDRIDAEELSGISAGNAFDVVQALRPAWLRSRPGARSFGGGGSVRVYVDGVSLGGVAALRNISRDAIVSMEYLDPARATQRWGTGHGAGAILVSTGTRSR